MSKLSAEIQSLSAAKVDLIFSITTPATLAVKQATAEREIVWPIGDLPVVKEGDTKMLRMVPVKRTTYALKFTRPWEKVKIEIDASPEQGSEAVISVRDSGGGSDMACSEKLLGVFQRLHHADEFEGMGIGLANVCCIIARHGGRTLAEAKVEEGATFYLALQRKQYGGGDGGDGRP